MSPAKAVLEAAHRRCNDTVLNLSYPNDGRLYCNRTFDKWGCWNDTLAGARAHIKCPAFITGFDPERTAFKDCNPDGTWWRHPLSNRSWSNYSTCVNIEELERNKRMIYTFISGYSVSIVALTMSLAIFFYFKQLKCDRITLHKNLFISYIVTGIVWILYYTMVSLNGDVLVKNPWWCRGLHIITTYFTGCTFFWMLSEGLYLHTIIVCAFTSGRTLMMVCYFVGWGLSAVLTGIYTAVRASRFKQEEEYKSCWVQESTLQYIMAGPIIASLLMNIVFLINIIRVLITKLRAVNSPETNQTSNHVNENHEPCLEIPSGPTTQSQNRAPLLHTRHSFIGANTRKAVRAILILIPLLGLQYLVIPFRPNTDQRGREIYSIISASVTSFQGFFVALIFCFCNGEVMAIIKRKWGQHKLMRSKHGSGRRGTLYSTQITTAEITKHPQSHVNTDV